MRARATRGDDDALGREARAMGRRATTARECECGERANGVDDGHERTDADADADAARGAFARRRRGGDASAEDVCARGE